VKSYNEQELRERVACVRQVIERACERSGRNPNDVRLVAVTKTHPLEALIAAWQTGLREFGENRVQEAASKFPEFLKLQPHTAEEGFRLHLIGHLQTNKAKKAVALFHLIHSVDSAELASELEKYAGREDKSVEVLVQVNVSGEATKSGVRPEETEGLVRFILEQCPHLRVMGYMTMAPFVDDPEDARPCFRQLRALRDQLAMAFQGAPNYYGHELSMGMTNDYAVAVEEGATIVRIGTALFGAR